jgi:Mycothiol maleylpyruvate isomerase N-terminal domain
MTERAQQVHAVAEQQIGELVDLVSALDDAALRRPCPGREKLGDGTVAALARHTADNYQRIAAFVSTSDRLSAGHEPMDHSQHGPSRGHDDDEYLAGNFDRAALVTQLSVARGSFGRVAQLTDVQLDAIPAKDSFRFCDGQRTLDQVLANLLKHQGHQLDALRAAVPSRPTTA